MSRGVFDPSVLAWVAITIYRRPRGLITDIIPHSSGGWEAQDQGAGGFVPGTLIPSWGPYPHDLI